MNLGSLIIGATGMYLYLRGKGIEPPPEVLKWERALRSAFVQTPKPPLLREKETEHET